MATHGEERKVNTHMNKLGVHLVETSETVQTNLVGRIKKRNRVGIKCSSRGERRGSDNTFASPEIVNLR